MQYITQNFPQQDYPKLYLKSKGSYEKGQQRFLKLNQAILALGLGFTALLVWRDINFGSPAFDVSAGFMFILQMLPFALLELSEHNYYKEARKQYINPIRKVSLTRRSIFNYVPHHMVILAIGLIFITMGVDYYGMQLAERSPIGKILNSLITNGLLFLLIFRAVHGKKPDPYQQDSDYHRQVAITVETLLLISISVSIFFIIKQSVDILTMGNFNPLLTSLYCILIGYLAIGKRLRCIKMDSINFDGYKA